MSQEDFKSVVDAFKKLKQWRDEKQQKEIGFSESEESEPVARAANETH